VKDAVKERKVVIPVQGKKKFQTLEWHMSKVLKGEKCELKLENQGETGVGQELPVCQTLQRETQEFKRSREERPQIYSCEKLSKKKTRSRVGGKAKHLEGKGNRGGKESSRRNFSSS